MRVHFVPGRDKSSPVARLRAHGFAAELARRGHATDVLPNFVPVLTPKSRLVWPVARTIVFLRRAVQRLAPGDVLYLVRIQSIPGIARHLVAQARKRGAAIVYDFDDAVFLQQPRRTRLLCKNADHVVVASQGLVRFVEEQGSPWSIVATPINPDAYPVHGGSSKSRNPVIGWSGTPSNLPFLEEIWPAVQAACERTGARAQVITRPDAVANLPGAERVPWRLDDYRSIIAGFRVGLSPLPDTPWTRGKLGYKAIEYQACGVPALVSPVQKKDKVVLEGQTGYHPESLDTWEERIVDLVTDDALHARMSEAARQHALERFSFEAIGRPLEKACEAALAACGHRG